MLYLCPYNACDYTSYDQAEIDEHVQDDHGPEAEAREEAEYQAYVALLEDEYWRDVEDGLDDYDYDDDDCGYDCPECYPVEYDPFPTDDYDHAGWDYTYSLDDPWYSGGRSDW